jgi:hypothetical protein
LLDRGFDFGDRGLFFVDTIGLEIGLARSL